MTFKINVLPPILDRVVNQTEAVNLVTEFVDNAQFSIEQQSADFTAETNKTYLINTASAVQVTLPATAAINLYVRIKDTTGSANTNPITIVTPASETIDGQAFDIIDSDYASKTYVFNGSNWSIL